jgi:hypothetical protein
MANLKYQGLLEDLRSAHKRIDRSIFSISEAKKTGEHSHRMIEQSKIILEKAVSIKNLKALGCFGEA